MKKQRLDLLLVEQGYFESREQAKRSIMAGMVFVNQEKIDKAGAKVPVDAQLQIKGQLHPYVSRGGLKLEEALRSFSLRLDNRVVIDIGASTGGFTDCALQNGAKRVYAIDVGYGQLAWKLRQDPRVAVLERTNFRYFKQEQLAYELPDFATIDVSFISLSQIFPALSQLLLPQAEVIALIKPQFEAGRSQVGKKGIVKDPLVHQQVILQTVQKAEQHGFSVQGLIPSPIQGGEGNIEFLCYLIYRKSANTSFTPQRIATVVHEAHQRFQAKN